MAISEETAIRRCADPNDPDRCKGTYNNNRCWFKVFVGHDGVKSSFCIKHSPSAMINDKRARKRNYYLGVWQQRINEQADSGHVKSLREEVGILRIIMEEMMIRCTSTDELLLESPRISELADRITKTVQVCANLETKSRFMLDSNAVLTLVEQILSILAEHITDPNVLQTIAMEIEKAVMLTQEVKDEDQTITFTPQKLHDDLPLEITGTLESAGVNIPPPSEEVVCPL